METVVGCPAYLGDIQATSVCDSTGWEELVLYELHHFSHGSQNDYGVASYLQMTDRSGKVAVTFLLDKSRLAPVRMMAFSRLVLLPVVVAVKVDCTLCRELRVQLDNLDRYMQVNGSALHKQ